MADIEVRRSSNTEMIANEVQCQGVGARHSDTRSLPRGGGYLDICTTFEVSEKKSRDPRISELHDMGISGFWRSLAEDIGFDAFLVVWESMSNQALNSDDGHRVYVPRYDAFMRYQRNRFIVALAGNGLKAKEIKEQVMHALGDDITTNHISRLIRQYNAN